MDTPKPCMTMPYFFRFSASCAVSLTVIAEDLFSRVNSLLE